MATIALYANQISQMTGMLKNVQTTVADYKETLFSLQNKALTISKSACELEEVISSIKASTQIQDDKMEALATFVTQTEEFVDEADRIDGNVKDVINERKDDFYEEYEYLRPECEKKKEKKSVVATIWGGIKSVGKSIGKGLKKAGEWCKEHWKAIVTVVIVIVAVVLICTGVGGILGAMAIGALLGALIGGLSGGIIAAVTGGNFWEGFEDGAFMGAISGIITGGLAGGNTAAALTLGKTMFIGGVSGSGSQFLSDLGDILIKGEDISIGELVINTVTAGVLGTAFAAAGYGLNKAFSWTKSLFKTKSGIDIEGGTSTSRPTWRQSELDAATDFPDYDAQKSFINGEEVPYGTKGSVRPDYYKDGFSVDIKNYNVESASGRSNLARNIEKQYYQRIENLPDGTKQSVMIDVRGQNVSDATLNALYDDIMQRTNNGVEILFKMD